LTICQIESEINPLNSAKLNFSDTFLACRPSLFRIHSLKSLVADIPRMKTSVFDQAFRAVSPLTMFTDLSYNLLLSIRSWTLHRSSRL